MGELKYKLANMSDEIQHLRKDIEYLQEENKRVSKLHAEAVVKIHDIEIERNTYRAWLCGIRDFIASLCQVLADSKTSLPFIVTADLVRWCDRLVKEVP